MTYPVLSAEKLGKSYATYGSELTRFARWFGFPFKPKNEFWASKNVTFSIEMGETVALIGQNGAGKSTLLKMIVGTVTPTTGKVLVNGRISAILELGLGFNAELTGRQNVMHSGGLLGYSDAELGRKMKWIEEFAEIGEHFDYPVRTYSSGMMARLAFSLATANRPELLIVDEVLSVGDNYFQHKSFNRIREFRDAGTTILFVTHGMSQVRELCSRVILLEKGKIVRDGQPDEVVDYYNALIAEKENVKLTVDQRRRKDGWLHSEFGTKQAIMEHFEVCKKSSGEPIAVAMVGEAVQIRSRIRVNQDLSELVIGHRITDRLGHVIWGSNTFHEKRVLKNLRAGDIVLCEVDFDANLGPGSYGISFGLHTKDTHIIDCYHKAENQVVIDVINASYNFFIGSAYLNASFDVEVLQSE